ncbi:MAG: hypothetical protein ACM4AI_24265 [Acidobacteriota bacterium]
MKIGFKIALAMLALVVGAGLGQAEKHIRRTNAEARLAQELSDKDARDAQACRDAGGMPIYGCFTLRLAGCYQPRPKK